MSSSCIVMTILCSLDMFEHNVQGCNSLSIWVTVSFYKQNSMLLVLLVVIITPILLVILFYLVLKFFRNKFLFRLKSCHLLHNFVMLRDPPDECSSTKNLYEADVLLCSDITKTKPSYRIQSIVLCFMKPSCFFEGCYSRRVLPNRPLDWKDNNWKKEMQEKRSLKDQQSQ